MTKQVGFDRVLASVIIGTETIDGTIIYTNSSYSYQWNFKGLTLAGEEIIMRGVGFNSQVERASNLEALGFDLRGAAS